jgi:hypothetical protein
MSEGVFVARLRILVMPVVENDGKQAGNQPPGALTAQQRSILIEGFIGNTL